MDQKITPTRLLLIGLFLVYIGLNFSRIESSISTFVGFIPKKFDIYLGDLYIKDLENYLYKTDDKQLKAELSKLADNLVYNKEEDEIPIKLYVVQINQPNAFALSNGNIYISRDLIQISNNTDELLAILAHEISHVRCRHGVKTLTKTFGIDKVYDSVFFLIFGSPNMSYITSMISSSNYSREQEKEADREAVKMLNNSGISPKYLISILEKISQKDKDYDLLAILSSHPTLKDRVAAIRKLMKNSKINYTNRVENHFDFKKLKLLTKSAK